MNSHPRPRPAYAVLALFLLFATACSTLPPVIRGPGDTQLPATVPPPAEASPEAVTGAPTVEVVATAMPTPKNAQPTPASTARLDGVVTYLQRIALSPSAVVEVKLQDISRADAPAVVVASQTIQTQGKQVPIPFSLEYDPASIDPRMTYSVSARITEDGVLTWISTKVYPVLTRSAPTNNVEIVVEPVRPG